MTQDLAVLQGLAIRDVEYKLRALGISRISQLQCKVRIQGQRSRRRQAAGLLAMKSERMAILQKE